MPQSLSAVYIHLVFSTRERAATFQNPELRAEVHAYLGGVSKTLDCPPLIVGGTADHIHLLGRMARTITQADWVKELKRVSTIWVKGKHDDLATFAWQKGYGCFSVSQSNVRRVTDYIAKQDEHHHTMGFQDEFRALMRKHNIEWDERYVWD